MKIHTTKTTNGYKSIISLGKVDYCNNGRSINEANFTAEIKFTRRIDKIDTDLIPIKKYITFSAQGEIWNKGKTDIHCGGQCLDNIQEDFFPKSPEILKLVNIWERWHLNDMNAGTMKQEKTLEKCDSNDYSNRCEFLKEKGLYEDRGYKFGHSWLCDPIPTKDLKEILELFFGMTWLDLSSGEQSFLNFKK